MKGCFIVNPKSGLSISRGGVYSIVQKIMTSGSVSDVEIMITKGKGDATEKAAELSSEKCDFVFAVGGDGTVNEVLNGLMKSGSGIPMGILPFGTTNDFANSLGLTRDRLQVAEMMEHFRAVPVDVGAFYGADKSKAHYFLNVAAGGMLSAVAHSVPSSQKNAFGRLAYLIEGAKNLSSLSLETTPLILNCDGVIYREDAYLFEISNSRSTGGFSKIAPSAYINDGKFNLCLIRKILPVDILPLFSKIATGTHTDDSRVLCLSAKKITVSYDYERAKDGETLNFPMDYDGEAAEDLPSTVENIPGALRLIVPDKRKTSKIVKDFEVNSVAGQK